MLRMMVGAQQEVVEPGIAAQGVKVVGAQEEQQTLAGSANGQTVTEECLQVVKCAVKVALL